MQFFRILNLLFNGKVIFYSTNVLMLCLKEFYSFDVLSLKFRRAQEIIPLRGTQVPTCDLDQA